MRASSARSPSPIRAAPPMCSVAPGPLQINAACGAKL
jgi:hypothetical protein